MICLISLIIWSKQTSISFMLRAVCASATCEKCAICLENHHSSRLKIPYSISRFVQGAFLSNLLLVHAQKTYATNWSGLLKHKCLAGKKKTCISWADIIKVSGLLHTQVETLRDLREFSANPNLVSPNWRHDGQHGTVIGRALEGDLERLYRSEKRGLDKHRNKYSNFRKLPNAMQSLCLCDIQNPRLVREYNTTHLSVLF